MKPFALLTALLFIGHGTINAALVEDRPIDRIASVLGKWDEYRGRIVGDSLVVDDIASGRTICAVYVGFDGRGSIVARALPSRNEGRFSRRGITIG